MQKYKFYDTLHIDQLIYSDEFENTFRKKFKSEFFVFGTNAKTKAKVKRIVFSSTECESDYIALVLEMENPIKNPLIASETDIPLEFVNDSPLIGKIKKELEKDAIENQYGAGNYNPKVFAKYQNYYFTYYDDFLWYRKNNNSGMQFPERCIVKNENGKIKVLWCSGMDLLGLPCL